MYNNFNIPSYYSPMEKQAGPRSTKIWNGIKGIFGYTKPGRKSKLTAAGGLAGVRPWIKYPMYAGTGYAAFKGGKSLWNGIFGGSSSGDGYSVGDWIAEHPGLTTAAILGTLGIGGLALSRKKKSEEEETEQPGTTTA